MYQTSRKFPNPSSLDPSEVGSQTNSGERNPIVDPKLGYHPSNGKAIRRRLPVSYELRQGRLLFCLRELQSGDVGCVTLEFCVSAVR